jgi:antitoxin component of MazEF toxin-antitoxin module
MMCVPAAWVEQFELMAGDSIEINQGDNGELILKPVELNL